jgi:hypothetical protein
VAGRFVAKRLRKTMISRSNSFLSSDGDVHLPVAPERSETSQISAGVLEDRALVEDCLAQKPTAWTRIYQACHQPLLTAIRLFLEEAAADRNLVDEIAARVWYAVVRNEGELLSRFDITRGCRLTTFLSVLAKSEARQYFRAESRRRLRERAASRPEVEAHPRCLSMPFASEEDFLRTLTSSERDYYKTVLISSSPEQTGQEYSIQNGWQLRHRVKKKLDQFLDSDG